MEDALTHLVVNWIDIEDDFILVGATDNLRWQWEKEEGVSGADAKSIVCVSLTEEGKGRAVLEKADFYAGPGDLSRSLAMSCLEELFEIAWLIKKDSLSYERARETFFGKEVKKGVNK